MTIVLSYRTSGILFFFFNDTATTEIYTLSLHDALPIFVVSVSMFDYPNSALKGELTQKATTEAQGKRSEEHTSELQSPCNLVCRLLLEKKKREPFHCVIYDTNLSTVRDT